MTPYRRGKVILLDHSVGSKSSGSNRNPKPPRKWHWPRPRCHHSPLVRLAIAVSLLVVIGFVGWRLATASERSHPGAPGEVDLGRNASLGGKRLFPADNAWNTPIDDRPVDPMSDAYLLAIGYSQPLHPDFGTNRLRNKLFGIPYVVVDASSEPQYSPDFRFGDESDPGPYPIPTDAPIEQGGDHHVLVLDRRSWRLYELFGVNSGAPEWDAGSGAIYDLNSNLSRPRGWTSADAAGLPILPGLVRADEVYDRGEIDHALRFTTRRTRRAYIYPARHQASRSKDPALPPMGLRLRLKTDVPIDDLPPGAKVIATALKRYGMILADNGGPLYLTGTADRRWKRRDTEALKKLLASDFEVIVSPPPPPSDTVAWQEIRKGLPGFSEQ